MIKRKYIKNYKNIKMTKFNEWLNESGIRNIKKLSKKFDKAEIYFHVDTDGVTSAIGMREYLESYRTKVIDAFPIQYGSTEYAVPKGRKNVMKVLVDFAHGKVMFQIHQDHHEGQVGVKKGTSTSFKKKPSGAGIISGEISPKDIFPPKDLKIIDTVDSADFASQGLTPDDIIRASFDLDKSISVEKNHEMMGLVVNKLLLTYKNKPNFLKELVMKSKPSLLSMYNVIKKLAKEHGYTPPEEIDKESETYQKQQKSKIKEGKLSDVKNLKSGESMQINGIIVQNSGGYMGKGRTYDRYTPFKLYPDADYFTIAWVGVGLLQLSQNPFKKLEKDLHLGNIVMNDVMPKFKNTLENINITLATLKRIFESDIKKKKIHNAVGFTFDDFLALYKEKVKKMPKEGSKFRDIIADISSQEWKTLSRKQKNLLEKISVPAWDVIMAGSGGHKSITNISGLNFIQEDQYSGGYVQLVKDIQYEIVKRMIKETKNENIKNFKNYLMNDK